MNSLPSRLKVVEWWDCLLQRKQLLLVSRGKKTYLDHFVAVSGKIKKSEAVCLGSFYSLSC